MRKTPKGLCWLPLVLLLVGCYPPAPREAHVLQGVTDVQQVAKLIGVGSINATDQRFGVYGADLGHMFDMDDRVYMVFGDSFGPPGGYAGGSDWRSNLMAIIHDRDPSDGLTFDTMIMDRPGHASELLSARRIDGDEITVIPTAGVAVGNRMYLHYMSVRQWTYPGEWELNYSGLAYSDDGGQTWTKSPDVTWSGDSNFGQVAIVAWGSQLFFFGIPHGRFGGVQLARVPAGSVLNERAYRYFAGMDGSMPRWSEREGEAVRIVEPPVGELSVMWNDYLGCWIMTYLHEYRDAIVIREAPQLWGPWSEPLVVTTSRETGLYAPYLHPWYVENRGEVIYFTLSQWRPYAVFWMRARLVK